MLGLVGNLLGSVASGALGLMGQNSANKAAQQMAGTRYQTATADMTAAGLNPAAMFGSGGPAPMAPIQSVMTAPAAAMKDAASSATQQLVAQKTIDQLTSQIAKTNADAANVRAATPGVGARSYLDVVKSDAVRQIPKPVLVPLVQGGFGADTMRSAGPWAARAGGVAASAKSAIDGVSAIPDAIRSRFGLSGPDFHSASALKRAWDQKSPALGHAIGNWWERTFPLPRSTTVYKSN